VTAVERLRATLARLAPRERRLLGAAAAVAGLVVVTHLALSTWDGVAALRSRVAGRERELAAVQALAARLRSGVAPADAAEPPLVTRLEQVATGTVGRERIADMTPGTEQLGAGVQEERVTLRVSGASLAEVVSLLHALEVGPVPLPVARLELRKLPATQAQFAATIEVARTRRTP
jgi:type II secretory pathway component PulM